MQQSADTRKERFEVVDKVVPLLFGVDELTFVNLHGFVAAVHHAVPVPFEFLMNEPKAQQLVLYGKEKSVGNLCKQIGRSHCL